MPASQRIDTAIRAALATASAEPAPGRLVAALDHAVLPGGARIRPTILMAVAQACGDDRPAVTDAAAAALELVHCASLVHDDLPCFDDADLRRGKPSVHRAHSEPLAVLTGDSLIVLAFDTLGRIDRGDAARALDLVRCLSAHSGMPGGICAGQGWESEAQIDLRAYHRAKTAALFMAATEMGAISAGQEPEPGPISARSSARPSRWPTICATRCCRRRPRQAGAAGRPARPAQRGRRAGRRGGPRPPQGHPRGAIASIPSCPGEAALAQHGPRQAQQIVPAAVPGSRASAAGPQRGRGAAWGAGARTPDGRPRFPAPGRRLPARRRAGPAGRRGDLRPRAGLRCRRRSLARAGRARRPARSSRRAARPPQDSRAEPASRPTGWRICCAPGRRCGLLKWRRGGRFALPGGVRRSSACRGSRR